MFLLFFSFFLGCHEVPPVNDFPLEMFQLPSRLPETTLLIVGIGALIQDIAVTVPRVSIQFFAGAPHFPREQLEICE